MENSGEIKELKLENVPVSHGCPFFSYGPTSQGLEINIQVSVVLICHLGNIKFEALCLHHADEVYYIYHVYFGRYGPKRRTYNINQSVTDGRIHGQAIS